jgi:hypothetical protein
MCIICSVSFLNSVWFWKHNTLKAYEFDFGLCRLDNNNIYYCNWVVTRWQWLFNTYTKHEIGTKLEIGYKT